MKRDVVTANIVVVGGTESCGSIMMPCRQSQASRRQLINQQPPHDALAPSRRLRAPNCTDKSSFHQCGSVLGEIGSIRLGLKGSTKWHNTLDTMMPKASLLLASASRYSLP